MFTKDRRKNIISMPCNSFTDLDVYVSKSKHEWMDVVSACCLRKF